MINSEPGRLTTAQAAERLGVKPATLYAYVSRGLIERRRGPGGSTYAEADVDRLAGTGRRARELPPLAFPSELTRIADGRCAYRGIDVCELSRERTFEEVAEWLWRGSWPAEPPRWSLDPALLGPTAASQALVPAEALPLDRIRVSVAVAAANDPLRHDTSAEAAVDSARRLLRLMVHTLPAVGKVRSPSTEPARGLAGVLWPRLTKVPATPERVAVLDAALVLLADHELAGSTLAVRTAAMLRADAYEVVGAGLHVVGGVRHGGSSLLLEPVLREVAAAGARRAVADRLRRDERISGFGHPLYPGGDPRATALLDRLDELDEAPGRVADVRDLAAELRGRGLPPPNVDLGLAGLAHAAQMVPGAGQAIFAIARTAGWVAHALEQYDQPAFLRARTIQRDSRA